MNVRWKFPEEIGKVLILLTGLTTYAQLIILTQYSFVTLFQILRKHKEFLMEVSFYCEIVNKIYYFSNR